MRPAALSGPVPVAKQNPQLVNLRNLPDTAAQNHQIIRLPAQPNIRRPNNYGRTPVPLVSASPASVVRLNRETGQCRLIRAFRVNGYPPAGSGITNSNDPKNKKVIHLVKLKATPTPPQPNMLNVLIQLPGKNVRPANLPTNPDAVIPKLVLNNK
jgi:hypothetical protein